MSELNNNNNTGGTIRGTGHDRLILMYSHFYIM